MSSQLAHTKRPQESGAKIRVEETICGCNERAIVIEVTDGDEETKENQEPQANDAGKHEPVAGQDLQSEKVASCLQKGLMLVFESMVEGEPEINGDEGPNKEATTFVVRLLVGFSQVGPLLGKSGCVIKQLTSESGAKIKVRSGDKLPSCASSSDELIQGIEGGPLGFSDYGGRRMGGFGGGNHQAIITNTTVEVVVPLTVVPSIYGQDGGCLKQIREISDAKIIINDPKPGAKRNFDCCIWYT